jgi:hypothetical protein
VLARVVDRDEVAGALAAGRRDGDRQRAGEVAPGERVRVRHDLVGRPDRDDVTAELTRAGAEVDDIVGRANRLLVVLHHEHGIADVPEPLQGFEESSVVSLMQPDARLIEDVQHPDEARADLSRQTNSLSFAPRQRAGRPVERQIVEPDVHQEAESLADLLEDAARDRRLALGQGQPVEERGRVLDGLPHDLRDGTARDLDPERFRPQTRPRAGRARALGHELRDLRPRLLGGGLAVAALERLDDALEAAVALAVEDHVAHGLAELGPWRLEREPVALGEDGQGLAEVRGLAPRPGRQGALLERARRVRHEALRIDLVARADAAALRARAVRVVEGEHARRDLREGDAAVRARQLLGECHARGSRGRSVREAAADRGWPAVGASRLRAGGLARCA